MTVFLIDAIEHALADEIAALVANELRRGLFDDTDHDGPPGNDIAAANIIDHARTTGTIAVLTTEEIRSLYRCLNIGLQGKRQDPQALALWQAARAHLQRKGLA